VDIPPVVTVAETENIPPINELNVSVAPSTVMPLGADKLRICLLLGSALRNRNFCLLLELLSHALDTS
jgi:hypothetical protein